MASGLMHLVVTKRLGEAFHVTDMDRLFFGCLLPDGAIKGNSHLKVMKDGKKTLDLALFRKKYQAELAEDAVYLGHYLHLVQDIYFRRFVYA